VSVRLSLLALLEQGPCYGYQLRAELDWRTGSRGPINVGQIYNTLDRLERDGLARKTGQNNYFEITSTGRAAVTSWFTSASPFPELASKLALAASLPGVDVAQVIRAQRDGISEIATIDAVPGTARQLAVVLAAAASSIAVAAEIALLDTADRLATLGIAPSPLSSEIPKRGRPSKPAA
jgi:DNA-binding PadR family transcriptional regulator